MNNSGSFKKVKLVGISAGVILFMGGFIFWSCSPVETEVADPVAVVERIDFLYAVGEKDSTNNTVLLKSITDDSIPFIISTNQYHYSILSDTSLIPITSKGMIAQTVCMVTGQNLQYTKVYCGFGGGGIYWRDTIYNYFDTINCDTTKYWEWYGKYHKEYPQTDSTKARSKWLLNLHTFSTAFNLFGGVVNVYIYQGERLVAGSGLRIDPIEWRMTSSYE